ncbi:MAG: tRNA uridine-5-carboxymethylaminomethyl(34) synthesis enzyme MnmG [Bacilli bacterium]|nr:tRNA uridine-5-carboxymethylaminomethyl(34) synthesis enzyme MnmG [Bacilli bacterium]MDD4831485.1 tRNA uridine-5-carboxymethylaminomethyl(34) synthesis enzyme MnmG [Bacilli bacterium]
MNYEVIVVGGGHAGCEAALATSRLCHKTLLVTGNFDIVAQMPCNPSIGGSAKGIVVREIDALGGEMGKCADKTLIQMKMLNTGKGPAVRSLRCQADKVTYPKEMLNTLKNQHNLDLLENMVENLIIENREVKGIILENGEKIYSRVVILTTGTYLKSDILVGNIRTRMGPMEQKPSLYLSDNLKKYGFEIIRLKTGTPQRIEKSSIDFSKTKIEQGSEEEYTFSFDNKVYYDVKNQVPCHLVHSTKETKQIILDNLNKSSIYGAIEEKLGVGPRYCPSFEDKIVKFEDKDTHQIFLEPESLYYDDIYLQGFSTSMPREVQDKLVHSLPGLENAIIKKYAYAIEYDAINPTQLKNTLETKIINNLFTAGQINGTSGYEEAACQGLMAGINAVFKLENKEPFVLTRNEAYIGVLIDDLITKGTSEPYRLLTSRAEYRLLLRHDNADLRLMDYGYKIGLIEEQKHQKFEKKKENINELFDKCKKIKANSKETIYEYLKHTESNINSIKDLLEKKYTDEELEQVEIIIKYEGYIKKTSKNAENMLKLEYKSIPENIDYNQIKNLATEARQKLIKIRPKSIGQASRISGVNLSDISVLLVYMKRYFKNE